ncbi:MAG TPA: prenyltransferase/squalene oxidase repeat-containing protein [Coleofasciculaceae cyanobacterium]
MNTSYKVHETSRFWLNVQECLRITLPPQDRTRLAQLRTAMHLGKPLPIQIFHSLEVLGREIDCLHNVHDVNGVFGGSPAATITMVTHSKAHQERSIAFISEMAASLGGALPTATQLNIFERSWLIYYLIQAGMPVPEDLGRTVAEYFMACLGPRGASFTPGQIPDADNSAMVLCVLSVLGYPIEPSCLLTYESETCFRCYDGERNPSVSTNAHILEAFGNYIARCRLSVPKYEQAIAKISTYLLSAQQQDGSWFDKWHASPYYATACSVLALQHFGKSNIAAALKRAITWVLHTQRDDGSWGFWCGTLEETAYALQILLLAGQSEDAVTIRKVVRRGERFLTKHLNAPPNHPVHMPLWHGKELYSPRRIVRAAVLSILYLCATIRSNSQPKGKNALVNYAA